MISRDHKPKSCFTIFRVGKAKSWFMISGDRNANALLLLLLTVSHGGNAGALVGGTLVYDL